MYLFVLNIVSSFLPTCLMALLAAFESDAQYRICFVCR
jgi:hypothetical protein